jgi:hypothetical protein
MQAVAESIDCQATLRAGRRSFPGLRQPLSDPSGKRRVVLDHQHPHLYQYAPAGMTSVQHRR